MSQEMSRGEYGVQKRYSHTDKKTPPPIPPEARLSRHPSGYGDGTEMSVSNNAKFAFETGKTPPPIPPEAKLSKSNSPDEVAGLLAELKQIHQERDNVEDKDRVAEDHTDNEVTKSSSDQSLEQPLEQQSDQKILKAITEEPSPAEFNEQDEKFFAHGEIMSRENDLAQQRMIERANASETSKILDQLEETTNTLKKINDQIENLSQTKIGLFAFGKKRQLRSLITQRESLIQLYDSLKVDLTKLENHQDSQTGEKLDNLKLKEAIFTFFEYNKEIEILKKRFSLFKKRKLEKLITDRKAVEKYMIDNLGVDQETLDNYSASGTNEPIGFLTRLSGNVPLKRIMALGALLGVSSVALDRALESHNVSGSSVKSRITEHTNNNYDNLASDLRIADETTEGVTNATTESIVSQSGSQVANMGGKRIKYNLQRPVVQQRPITKQDRMQAIATGDLPDRYSDGSKIGSRVVEEKVTPQSQHNLKTDSKGHPIYDKIPDPSIDELVGDKIATQSKDLLATASEDSNKDLAVEPKVETKMSNADIDNLSDKQLAELFYAPGASKVLKSIKNSEELVKNYLKQILRLAVNNNKDGADLLTKQYSGDVFGGSDSNGTPILLAKILKGDPWSKAVEVVNQGVQKVLDSDKEELASLYSSQLDNTNPVENFNTGATDDNPDFSRPRQVTVKGGTVNVKKMLDQ